MMLGYISLCPTREHKIFQTPNLVSLILAKETLKHPIYLHCLSKQTEHFMVRTLVTSGVEEV